MENFFKILFKTTDEVENAKKAIDERDFTKLIEALENNSNIDDIEQILNYAMENSDEKTIDIITSKIDPNKKDEIIDAALKGAFEKKNPEIIKALLNNLKEPKPESLENLLIKALKLGNPEIIKQLLDKGAKVSEQNIDGLIEIVISAKNKNFYSFKNIVKLLTEKLTKDTTQLLEKLRPDEQDKLYEELAKKLEQLKELTKLEELKENKEQKEASPREQAIEELMKAVKSIKENKPDDAKIHLDKASLARHNPALNKIASELKNNLDKWQKKDNREPFGTFTKQLSSEQQSQGRYIERG
ncbi:MAG: hypothetical protein ISP24_04915 [Rickettsiales bacterium]|nr:hypothetical protein [Rickettsiales bacterium]